jgi:hypothetical protein
MYHIRKCPVKYNGEQDSGEFHEYTHHNPLESCCAVDHHDYVEYNQIDLLETNAYESDSTSMNRESKWMMRTSPLPQFMMDMIFL